MIYKPHNCNLGDHWQTISLCKWHAARTGEVLGIALGGMNTDQRLRLKTIADLMTCPELGPNFTDANSDNHFDGYHIWAAPPWPTRQRWIGPACERLACYQFDGHSSAECKNPPIDQSVKILSHLESAGIKTQRIGIEQSLPECVELLSRAALFVGCCSGMSHVAHSVGVPVYLYEHRLPVVTCHRQKQYVLVRSADDFIAQVRPYLELL